MWLLAAVAAWAQPDTNVLRQVFQENLARRQRQYGPTDFRTVQATRDLGLFLAEIGDLPGARRTLNDIVRIDEMAVGAAARQTLEDAAALARISPAVEAEPLLVRVADSTDPALAVSALSALAGFRKAAGDKDGEIELLRRALTKAEMVDRGDGPNVAIVAKELGRIVLPKECADLLQRSLDAQRHQFGARSPVVASTEIELTGMLLAAGREDEAEKSRPTP